MNDLLTVFEISASANGVRSDLLWRIAIGLVMLTVAIRWIGSLKKDAAEGKRWINPIFFLVMAVVWTGVHLALFWASERTTASLLRLYRAGHVSVVEGNVRVTHEQPSSGHSKGDVILIGAREFEIDYWRQTPGYNLTIAHGGVLRGGVHARLTYDNGVLLKVEVAPSSRH